MNSWAIITVASAGLLVGACHSSPPPPVGNYFDAQKGYASELDKRFGQGSVQRVAAPPLFDLKLGWVTQGVVWVDSCLFTDPPPSPAPDSVDVQPLPPSLTQDTFQITAQLPASITKGFVSAGVDLHKDDLVKLEYEAPTGQLYREANIQTILADPRCKKIVLLAQQGGKPATIVKGQILAKQKYTWLRRAGASLNAQVNAGPGEPIGFKISGGTGPSDPLVLTETATTPHFLIVEDVIPSPVPGGLADTYAPFQTTATSPSTLRAIAAGAIRAAPPTQRP